MHRRPSKRKQILNLTILYTSMTLFVLLVVSLLVLITQGYRFDRTSGTLEQQGLVQFASTPSGATIEIDDRRISSRTPAKASVEPGARQFVVYRDRYEPWVKEVDVSAGSLLWLNKIRLVPTERPVATINTYAHIHASSASPTQQSILLQFQPTDASFRFIDITRDNPSGSTIRLPSDLYTVTTPAEQPDERPTAHEFRIGEWDERGRYVFIEHRYGEVREWLVLDTRQPDRSRNVSREFAIPISNLRFSGTSGNIFYALTNGNIRKLDSTGGTISRPLVSDVEQFNVYETNTLYYTGKSGDSRVAGVYRDGDIEPYVVYTSPSLSDERVSIAVTRYFNTTYTALSVDSVLYVYRGDHTSNGSNDSLQTVTVRRFDTAIDRVVFSPGREYVFVRAGNDFGSYSLESQLHTTSTLGGDMQATSLRWLDDAYLWNVEDGQLTIRELDGGNTQPINTATGGQVATLSRNGTYLYSIDKTSDDQFALQRVRMILR